MFLFRTQENRRPGVIPQVVYKNKEHDRPKTNPWGTPDNTGTDLRLDYLKLLVESAQRATS